MITLRFLHEHNIGATLIRAYTWDYWNHVEIALPEGYLGARILGGVKIRPLNYSSAKAAFALVQCDDNTTQKVLEFAKQQIGKPYSIDGIIGLVLHKDWGNRNSWFCSELVAACFDVAGYPIIDCSQVDRLSPRDITLSPLVVFNE